MYEESQQLELEKRREKSKLDLEIARIRANDKDNNTEVNCNDSSSVDSLIKREKAANIIIYLKDEDLKNYDKIKSIILQEFEPTPQSCLENFKKATRQNCESHIQFASRLTTNWECYLKLRDVSNFEVLKQLIVSDKIFSTLDKETASHISVRQADKWFDPLTLGKEIDLFYSSRGKPLKSSFVNLKFFVNAAKKSIILLCVSLETQILRVKGSFNLLHWEGRQKEPETEESSMSQLSAKASVFKPINYIGEISKESQGVGDLFTATSYNTVFGYITSGSIPVSSENKPHCGLIKDNVDLEKTMRRFWEIENVEPETIKNKETIIYQRKLQRILWRENMDEPIKTFELSTVTYGTTSAPFLATRTLKQLALDEAENFPIGSSVVMSDMYIDDVLTSSETLLEANN
ncbi:DUF5641 domain-containing protein [Trichonephila clavipes]|nr:DUF5641 domain-containing protein [Trichonephila clavipes]